MAFITINYNEGCFGDLGYKSVELYYGKDERYVFHSGNFVKDWYNMRKFIMENLYDSESHFCNSSSVDGFIMDGAQYDSAYLHMIDEKPVLKYLDKSDSLWVITQADIYLNGGLEFFVPKGTQPTFEELKEMCK